MGLSRNTILSIVPDVTGTENGWLAVSEPGSPLKIGVAAATEQEAQQRFQEELEAWADLAERPAE